MPRCFPAPSYLPHCLLHHSCPSRAKLIAKSSIFTTLGVQVEVLWADSDGPTVITLKVSRRSAIYRVLDIGKESTAQHVPECVCRCNARAACAIRRRMPRMD